MAVQEVHHSGHTVASLALVQIFASRWLEHALVAVLFSVKIQPSDFQGGNVSNGIKYFAAPIL